ncbi:phosphoesterase, partial [Xanthomonas perforans]|nr:phosphoesterase [Xanthomonas perforans]
MMAARRSVSALLAAIATISVPASAADHAAEPNTQVPAGSTHYVADGFPDRIVATPAQDAATG